MEIPLQPFDVCIVCALPEEVKAFLEIAQEYCENTLEERISSRHQYSYRFVTLKNNKDEPLNLHISWPPRYGPQEMTLHLARVLEECQPRMAIMTGICAGDSQQVQLGDLVVAERTFTYDNGKFTRDEQGRSVHLHDTMTYQLDANILQFLGLFDGWKPLVASLERPLSQPEQRPTTCHIKAMASGSAVRTDHPFEEIQVPVRGTVAIDMEGAALGLVMSRHPLIRWLVVKGVCDYADQTKNNAYHGYAARASAIYALSFIQTYVISERLPQSGGPLPSSRAESPGIWNVPYMRNLHFTGRDELLNRLNQRLSSETQDHSTVTRRATPIPLQAIKGLGGIGKTQIAVEYAYRSREQGLYTHIFWVNAASETIMESFVALTELLSAFPAKRERDQWKLVKAIKCWLEQCQQRWLLIFDNADDIALLPNYLPQWGNGNILLTTRVDALGSLDISAIEVKNMSLKEGIEFLLHRVQHQQISNEEQCEVANVVIALDSFPLALDQAGAYLDETRCGFVEYLKIYQDYRKELLARRGKQTTSYPDSVATTWLLAFHKVKQANPAAIEFLQLCAFLAPDKIPEELIKKGASHWPALLQQAVASLFTFNQIIEDLLNFSLVKRLIEDQTFIIHRLVQIIIKDALDAKSAYLWVKQITCAIIAAFPEPDFTQWKVYERYLPHILHCSYLIQQEKIMTIESIRLINHAGIYLYEHARYEEAELLYGQALAIQDQCLDSDYSDKASLLTNLASTYENHGRYTEAKPLFVQALAIYEQHVGPEHSDIAKALYNLAHLYESQGCYDKAEPLYLRALAICEQQSGGEDLQTAQCLDGLAEISKKRGKYTLVESLYQRALAIREQQLGLEHPHTAIICHNLANFYEELGRYNEAEPLYHRALTICEQQLGKEHRSTTACLIGLANLLCHQRRFIEAGPLYERALVINEQHLGSDHPSTLTNLNNLAVLYENQGQYEKAELLYQRVLASRKQYLGHEHPDTTHSLNNLACLHCTQGRYAESELLFMQALTIQKQQLGSKHPLVALTLKNMASLYFNQKRYVEAESLYQTSLHLQEQALGVKHPEVLTLLFNFVALYIKQDQYAKAEPFYERALQILKQECSPTYLNLVPVLKSLASLYAERKKYREAEQLYQQTLQICQQVLGLEHPEVASPLNSLGTLYREQRLYKEAEPLYEQSLYILERSQSPEHPLVAAALNNLANLYREQGKQSKAELLYERAICLWEQVLGAEHPLVAYLLSNLASSYQEQEKYKEAKPLYERALHILEQTLAPINVDLAEILYNLAVLQEIQGNLVESQTFYKRALLIQEQTLELTHPNTVNTRKGLYNVTKMMSEIEKMTYFGGLTACNEDSH